MKLDSSKFADGKPIKEWRCTKCKAITQDIEHTRAEATAGHYGPNGNGFNYWCETCGGRMNPYRKTHEQEINDLNKGVLDAFFGGIY